MPPRAAEYRRRTTDWAANQENAAERRTTARTNSCVAPRARCVPRETISKRRMQRTLLGLSSPGDPRRCYELPTKRRVNTQLLSLLVAQRPPNSRRLVESEKASRSRPPGTPVTDPMPGHGDDGGALTRCSDSDADAPSRTVDAGTSSTDGRNVEAGAGTVSSGRSAAVSTPSERASSIIPSKRPRTETPRRAASASTQARRSWSSRMPTTVDLVVAMTRLTVIRGVYINGRKTVAARLWSFGPPIERPRQRCNWAIAAEGLPRGRYLRRQSWPGRLGP